MRCGVELYRHAFEHEVAANRAMLKMLASVPKESRRDDRFQRAVNIATHMATCRQSFLDIFKGLTLNLEVPFEERADYERLLSRFAKMESDWTEYLAEAEDSHVDGSFVFADNGQQWRMSLEAQLFQLIGHAAYHRGQVVLLVDSLGGATFDTDYIEWFTEKYPDQWAAVL